MLEVGDQLVRRGEDVGSLFAVETPVVAFIDLVVVAQDAHPINHMREPALESACRAPNRLRDPPQHQFGEGDVGIGYARANELNGLHVGYSTDTGARC